MSVTMTDFEKALIDKLSAEAAANILSVHMNQRHMMQITSPFQLSNDKEYLDEIKEKIAGMGPGTVLKPDGSDAFKKLLELNQSICRRIATGMQESQYPGLLNYGFDIEHAVDDLLTAFKKSNAVTIDTLRVAQTEWRLPKVGELVRFKEGEDDRRDRYLAPALFADRRAPRPIIGLNTMSEPEGVFDSSDPDAWVKGMETAVTIKDDNGVHYSVLLRWMEAAND